jgi:hypothetical protein
MYKQLCVYYSNHLDMYHLCTKMSLEMSRLGHSDSEVASHPVADKIR